MVLSCYKSISSLTLFQLTTTTHSLNGCTFFPNRVLLIFSINLWERIFFIHIEVANALLEYNLILRRSWFYFMTIDVSSLFHILNFPHEGKIVMINQLAYCTMTRKITMEVWCHFLVIPLQSISMLVWTYLRTHHLWEIFHFPYLIYYATIFFSHAYDLLYYKSISLVYLPLGDAISFYCRLVLWVDGT